MPDKTNDGFIDAALPMTAALILYEIMSFLTGWRWWPVLIAGPLALAVGYLWPVRLSRYGFKSIDSIAMFTIGFGVIMLFKFSYYLWITRG